MHHSVRIDHAVSLVPISLRFGGGFPSKINRIFENRVFFCGFFDFVVCDSAIQSEVRQFPRMNVVRKKAARVKLDSGSNPIQSILRIDSARQLSIELVFLHHLEEEKSIFSNLVVFAYPLPRSLPTISQPRGLCLPFPTLS